MRCPFLAVRSPFVGRLHSLVARLFPLLGVLRLSLAVYRTFLGTYRVSVAHPHPQRTTLPLRAEHRDALSALPKGLREVRRVLGATDALSLARRQALQREGVRRAGSARS
jgi:hypothetical protein